MCGLGYLKFLLNMTLVAILASVIIVNQFIVYDHIQDAF